MDQIIINKMVLNFLTYIMLLDSSIDMSIIFYGSIFFFFSKKNVLTYFHFQHILLARYPIKLTLSIGTDSVKMVW